MVMSRRKKKEKKKKRIEDKGMISGSPLSWLVALVLQAKAQLFTLHSVGTYFYFCGL